ncbi:ketopantoate reductase family protein [Haladaptatus halobius]|uniref:ketopantoate reductase family protein n=1 Tax=Haladaptatus halobius TaxID=2884875 RepID=UPI001D0BDBBB|nr:2-dehydropantoate 2-reductase [Haladaptatus halobius]
MNVAVVGAGALGCLFGGRLAAAGQDVWLLHHRQSYVDRLNEDGLRIESDVDGLESTTVSIPATTDADEVAHVDLVLVFVKAHQTRAALEQHKECISPETRVLSLQNGIRHYDHLVDFVGERRALAGVTYQGAVVEEPGVVRHTSDGSSTFGGADAEFARKAERALVDAGFPIKRVDDPLPAIWSKQLISLPIKPLAALTRLPSGKLVEQEELVAFMDKIIMEAERVAAAKGIEIPNEEPLETVIEICEAGDSHRSSMLQDVLAERKTEINAVNGAIVELSREEGVDVPANELVTWLVRGLERSYLDGR